MMQIQRNVLERMGRIDGEHLFERERAKPYKEELRSLSI